MADFLDRLAERTLGLAPVVQPMLAPRFAPEPDAYPPDLERHVEAPVSPSISKGPQDRLSRGAPRADTGKARRPQGEARTDAEIRSDLAPIRRNRPQESTDSRPRPHRSAEPNLVQSEADTSSSPGTSTSEKPGATSIPLDQIFLGDGTSASGSPPSTSGSSSSSYPVSPDIPSMTPENRRSSPSTAPRSHQTLDMRHELRPLAESDPTESRDPTNVLRPAENISRPAESVPDRTVLPPTDHLAERTSGSEIAPEPVSRASSPGSETPSVTSAPADRDRRAPETVLSGVSIRPGGGLQERRPASSPEAQPPTVRVNIGRIEVRAVTPPPAPPRQTTPPARLSLDDYLKQRSGGGQR